ncbi:unnamed protein product [Cylicocyclus nassatus]|uniref:Uncharacterized protein n=1 Tax=Cylicocyclus nassatus TaxID=53992 RepID=A0AA36GRP8_CYLNA|nr:unnamed protein product [Cylicocyclus nassatus]
MARPLTLSDKERKSFDIGFDYIPAEIQFEECAKIRRMFVGMQSYFDVVLYPILVFTALTNASEEENGIKEFLVVMGLRRETLALSSVIFASFKAVFAVAVAGGPIWNLHQSVTLDVIFPTLLLCIGAAAMGLLCSRMVKSTTAALIVSCFVVVVSNAVDRFLKNYRKDIFHHICLLSIFSAYQKCIFAIRLSYFRGVENIFANLFAYEDVINVGTSLIIMVFDIAIFISLAVLLDYMSHAPTALCYRKFLADVKTAPDIIESYHDSWHEKSTEAVEPALLVDSVSKVWENTGEVALKKVNMKAYSGQVLTY